MDGGSDSKMLQAAEQKLSTRLHYREVDEIVERPLFPQKFWLARTEMVVKKCSLSVEKVFLNCFLTYSGELMLKRKTVNFLFMHVSINNAIILRRV